MPLARSPFCCLFFAGAAVCTLISCEIPPHKTPVPDAPLSNYTVALPENEVTFDMVGIPGGTFLMGSPSSEGERSENEGPQREVTISAFWIGKHEVTWDEYDLWSTSPNDVDGVTRPTPAYTDMTFGMGRERYPAICMTHYAAQTYCEWLSKITGHTYRLPTEAEWEYACRAGSETAYYFGDDIDKLDEHGWHEGNSEEEYHEVGSLKANPFGLFDMHGNVAEWTMDQHAKYTPGAKTNPLVVPSTLYPRSVRGGGWSDEPKTLRSAARTASHEDWKDQDPQIPKSIWYHTDADFVGFRVVREWKPGESKP